MLWNTREISEMPADGWSIENCVVHEEIDD